MTGLAPHHHDLLVAAAVDLGVAERAGLRSVAAKKDLDEVNIFHIDAAHLVPGLLFPMPTATGGISHQYRPDVPCVDDKEVTSKYLFPKGTGSSLWVHPDHQDRLAAADQVVIVEGTKQFLAAVSIAPAETLIVGVAGCYGWSQDGAPVSDFNALTLENTTVTVMFDADITTNRNVWTAADKLAEHLRMSGAKVRFASVPGTTKAGLDDVLGKIDVDKRTAYFARILDDAIDKLGRPPAKKKSPSGESGSAGSEWFDENGLRAVTAATHLMETEDLALGRDGHVWVYRDGVYQPDRHHITKATTIMLGDQWRRFHADTVTSVITAELATAGIVLPDVPSSRLVNVQNGMLDPITATLTKHHPRHLSPTQLAVAWDPGAECPTFEKWIRDAVGNQWQDLLEALGLVLTASVMQRKAVFLFGVSHSGKSTLMRLVEAIIGRQNTSAVTLHQLCTNRFAAAALYGKALNAAGDLSDVHIDDLAVFKQLTGDDAISAEAKFRDPFTFHNTALFVFSANTPPTVAETSSAYMNRIRPYAFTNTFEGHEDPTIEAAMMAELPGILVRLVEGVQRWHNRGGYAPANPVVVDLFARQSDRTRLFVGECTTMEPGAFTTARDLFEDFKKWAEMNGRKAMGRNNFLSKVDLVLGPRVRGGPDGKGARGWRDVQILPEDQWEASDDLASATSATFTNTSPHEAGHIEDEGEDKVVPCDGEVGTEAAEVAEQPSLYEVDPNLCHQCQAIPAGSFSGGLCIRCSSDAARAAS